MIAAPVTEFQFVCFCSICQGDDLMSKADTKHRPETDQGPDRTDRFGNIRGIARTVGNEYSIRIHGPDHVSGSVPRNDCHAAPQRVKAADNVPLHAAVDCRHMQLFIHGGKRPGFFTAHAADRVPGRCIQAQLFQSLFQRRIR